MSRTVYVKEDLMEVGVGSVPATLKWESDTTEYGAFAHLAVTEDGRYVLSITDMEEHGGSYTSVEVTFVDLVRLRAACWHLTEQLPPGGSRDEMDS